MGQGLYHFRLVYIFPKPIAAQQEAVAGQKGEGAGVLGLDDQFLREDAQVLGEPVEWLI